MFHLRLKNVLYFVDTMYTGSHSDVTSTPHNDITASCISWILCTQAVIPTLRARQIMTLHTLQHLRIDYLKQCHQQEHCFTYPNKTQHCLYYHSTYSATAPISIHTTNSVILQLFRVVSKERIASVAR